MVTGDAAIRGDGTARQPAPRPERPEHLHPVCLSGHVVRGPRATVRVWTALGRQSGAMAGFGVGQGASRSAIRLLAQEAPMAATPWCTGWEGRGAARLGSSEASARGGSCVAEAACPGP